VPDALWSAPKLPDADGPRISGAGRPTVRAGIESSLARLGVRFDVWK
jgi:hypothetical protein